MLKWIPFNMFAAQTNYPTKSIQFTNTQFVYKIISATRMKCAVEFCVCDVCARVDSGKRRFGFFSFSMYLFWLFTIDWKLSLLSVRPDLFIRNERVWCVAQPGVKGEQLLFQTHSMGFGIYFGWTVGRYQGIIQYGSSYGAEGAGGGGGEILRYFAFFFMSNVRPSETFRHGFRQIFANGFDSHANANEIIIIMYIRQVIEAWNKKNTNVYKAYPARLDIPWWEVTSMIAGFVYIVEALEIVSSAIGCNQSTCTSFHAIFRSNQASGCNV